MIEWLADWLTEGMNERLSEWINNSIQWLTDSLNGELAHWMNDCRTDFLALIIDWRNLLTIWLTDDWLTEWLMSNFIGWLTNFQD